MKSTRELWGEQDRHEGDRLRLFRTLAGHVEAADVLYPGSYVDVAPSFVFPSVTYIDMDARAERFFADRDTVAAIIGENGGTGTFTFHRADSGTTCRSRNGRSTSSSRCMRDRFPTRVRST